MAEVIKKGNKHRVMVCKHCECIFSYRPWEIYQNRKHYYVDCPDCLCANIIERIDKNNIQEAH